MSLLLLLAMTAADADRVADPSDSIRDLIRDLGVADFAVREAASDALAARIGAGGDLVPPLAEAAGDRNRERGSRAVALLERIAFVTPLEDDASKSRADAAEFALTDLARGEDLQAAALARDALRRHDAERQRRAVEAIRGFGGVVEYRQGGYFDGRVRGLIVRGNMRFGPAGGFGQPMPAIEPTDPGQLRIDRVRLPESWSGGGDGLRHLERLEHAGPLTIRLEGYAGQPEFVRRVEGLKAVLPEAKVDRISTAALSLSAATSTPLRVSECLDGGACARAGIQPGDIIRTFDGQPVNSLEHVKAILLDYKPGQTVPVAIERFGRTLELSLTLDDWSINDKRRRLER